MMSLQLEPPDGNRELANRVEAVCARAACTVAERDRLHDLLPALQARRAAANQVVSGPTDGPMARFALRLGLTGDQIDFFWAATAVAVEPRACVHVEALAGGEVRRGLSVAAYSRFTDLSTGAARELATWLACDNPLVREGLLIPDEMTTAVMRCYRVPPRVLAHLRDDITPDPELRRIELGESARLVFDEAQHDVVARLAQILDRSDAIVILEGPRSSGKTTAIARAATRPLIVLDAGSLAGDSLRAALFALRRELVLVDALPVITDADRIRNEDRPLLAAFARCVERALLITSSMPDLEVGVERPLVRLRWTIPTTPARRQLWEHFAGSPIAGDLDTLATRFRVGAGTIARAVKSARMTATSAVDTTALVAGLRHNISEDLGGLAQRIDVTQGWEDLVLSPDTLEQVNTLIARVRHAHHVLERWRYGCKLARGTGVPALFSGPPGTGKTMVAGLIARELGLDLYQVDLSQIVSKWIGETEKQLARVFDAAEQGHGLLLFDEADALFGQRTQDVKGATDRYANLEVNYLLQRVESFGGITILTTNLDQSIDRALKRRLAAHIVFELPDETERETLWRRLITTDAAPLHPALDFEALAREFPKMSGANIRNAALAAAFLAASDGAPAITQDRLVRAARGEYRSMGHVLADSLTRRRR